MPDIVTRALLAAVRSLVSVSVEGSLKAARDTPLLPPPHVCRTACTLPPLCLTHPTRGAAPLSLRPPAPLH